MHFLNKLSTAALMRLTILASVDLLLYRLLGGWDFFLQPFVFLNLVTLNLGLYAVMVYSGTLNKTLIGMMLGGLATTLTVFAYPGIDPHGKPRYHRIGRFLVVSLVDLAIGRPPPPVPSRPPLQATPGGRQARGRRPPAPISSRQPLQLSKEELVLIGWVVIDLIGLIAIVTGGITARILQARSRRREIPAALLPLDDDAVSPL
jgi:hypothetical protein